MECRCEVPKYGNNYAMELPICNKEIMDIMEEFQELFKSVSEVALVEEFQI